MDPAMREADTLAALSFDLRALSSRERRALLAALSPFERAQVDALLEAAEAPAPPEGPDLSRLSPWLARHLGEGDGDRNLTAATRRLLAEARAGLTPAPAPKRRSLADAALQWLSVRPALR
jgi:hypothetical protein